MMYIYYTGCTPEAQNQFLEDYKDADCIKRVEGTGRVQCAEYVDSQAGDAAWERAKTHHA
jgi:hypothetical protein